MLGIAHHHLLHHSYHLLHLLKHGHLLCLILLRIRVCHHVSHHLLHLHDLLLLHRLHIVRIGWDLIRYVWLMLLKMRLSMLISLIVGVCCCLLLLLLLIHPVLLLLLEDKI